MKLARSLFATLFLVLVPVGAATPSAWEPSAAGWTSGPIRHIGTIPVDTGTAVGATIHEDRLYVTSWRALSIYDITEPAAPVLLSTTPLGFRFINEGPVTNGEILLTMQDTPIRTLYIYDVTDPAAPRAIAQFPTAPLPDHTWACVLDCAYAYGSGGSILDLADPAKPVRVGNWRELAPTRGVHGIAEVAPGLVLTGSLPQYYLDARETPARPAVVASVDPPTTRFNQFRVGPPAESPVSYVDWPRGGRSRFALTTLETPFSGACNASSGGLVTYDTEGHEDTRAFGVTDVYRITRNGSPADGLAPENAIGCGALGLDAHPAWKNRGLVAVGWAEHGLRLLQVDKKGAISEVGGFIGHGTEAFMPIWASPTILYSIDTSRGIDVLELAG